jgi:GTP:adenosylcobinamide-phosphate guanylyltransferase
MAAHEPQSLAAGVSSGLPAPSESAEPERGFGVQALLLAGDGQHSRSVQGRSKSFVEIGGRPMFLHVLETLLRTPEVSEVFVIGNAPAIEAELRASDLLELAFSLGCPVHVIPQRATLYENVWHGFLAAQPPGPIDPDRELLVVPADVPLAIPAEISQFMAEAWAADADYVLGLTPDVALQPFAPSAGQPGIDMACFNLADGRFRQNNLHLVRPMRIENRHYIEDMYESRYQKEFGSMLRLVGRLLRREYRHLWVLIPYAILHLAGVLDRQGLVRAARAVRRFVSLDVVERASSALLKTRFRTVNTGFGGAALDIDNDEDLAVAEKMLGAWRALQTERAAPVMLPPR